MPGQTAGSMPREMYGLAWGQLVHALRTRPPFLSQAVLCEQVGITQSTLSRIERGEVSPDLFVARAIARALGVRLDEMDEKIARAWNALPAVGNDAMRRALLVFSFSCGASQAEGEVG